MTANPELSSDARLTVVARSAEYTYAWASLLHAADGTAVGCVIRPRYGRLKGVAQLARSEFCFEGVAAAGKAARLLSHPRLLRAAAELESSREAELALQVVGNLHDERLDQARAIVGKAAEEARRDAAQAALTAARNVFEDSCAWLLLRASHLLDDPAADDAVLQERLAKALDARRLTDDGPVVPMPHALTWPEQVLEDAQRQFAGLVVLDACGLVPVARWTAWARQHQRLAQLMGLRAPSDVNAASELRDWIAAAAAHYNVSIHLARFSEGEELARQCLYHEVFEFVDAKRRPASMLRTFTALRSRYGVRWWMEDLDRACVERGRPVPASALRRDVPWLVDAAQAHITTNVRHAPGPVADEERAEEIKATLPDWSELLTMKEAHYAEEMRGLQRPTSEQIRRLIKDFWSADDWQLPALDVDGDVESVEVVFYLDPHAGQDRILDTGGRAWFLDRMPHTLRVHRGWRTTAEYRERYGCLSFATSVGNTSYYAVPHSVSRIRGRERTYLLDLSTNRAVVWTKHGRPFQLPHDALAQVRLPPLAFYGEEQGVTYVARRGSELRRRAEGQMIEAIEALCRRLVFTSEVESKAVVLHEDGRFFYCRLEADADGRRKLVPVIGCSSGDFAERALDTTSCIARHDLLEAAARISQPAAVTTAQADLALQILGHVATRTPADALGHIAAADANDLQLVIALMLYMGRRASLEKGSLDAALLLYTSAEIAAREVAPESKEWAEAVSFVGFVQHQRGQFAEAAAAYREHFQWIKSRHAEQDHAYLLALHNLGTNLARSGSAEEGEDAMRRALRLHGPWPSHRSLKAKTARQLAIHLLGAGDAVQSNGRVAWEEALELLELCLQDMKLAGEDNTLEFGIVHREIADVAAERHLEVKALGAYKEALRIHERVLGMDDDRTRLLASVYYGYAVAFGDVRTVATLAARYDPR